MIAIHQSSSGFRPRWVAYCEKRHIPFKLVNCYANDIVSQLTDCKALFWHHHHQNPTDILVARQIINALEHSGFRVFPDFRTAWHFDDKVGQKYLLEAIGAPLVPVHVFYDIKTALEWAVQTSYPKVWKLRGGAGSANVQLVGTQAQAIKKIKTAFGRGFSGYDALGNLRERWRKYRLGNANIYELMKGVARLAWPPPYARYGGRDRGYVYFQDFVPNNNSDTRVVTIAGKAFAIKRFVRHNDFRASGSGRFTYEREAFDERCVSLALDLTKQLNAQCLAYDFVFDENGKPKVIEISYGFTPSGYDRCPGFWDSNLTWHECKFDPYGWMLELLLSGQ